MIENPKKLLARFFFTRFSADNKLMSLDDLILEFLAYIKGVRNLSENTVCGYANDLKKLENFLTPDIDINTITKENLLLSIGELTKANQSAASVNRFIAAVRTMFSYSRKTGHTIHNPAIELKNVKLPKRVPNFMTKNEINSLCNAPVTHELLWQSRDKALFEMLYSSGCRISEIVNLCLDDFVEGYHSAVVRGKGRKDRIVYFEKDSEEALKLYLIDRKKVIEEHHIENPTKQVFINQRGMPITVKGAAFIISKYSGPEGINHHVNPHAFRHTFATQLLNNGADVRIVQELLGHSNISTTQKYTHITTEQLIKTYNNSHPHGK